jgi:hypothetical protein
LVEINCTAISGPGFTIPYATIKALAGAKGVPEDQAKSIATAEAYSWVGNEIPRDVTAKLASAIAAHAASQRAKPPKPKRETYSEGFDAFWEIYPRKEGKGKAHEIWEKLTLPQRRKAWLAVKQQAPTLAARMRDRAGNLCPHPSTWLNQNRFDDEITEQNQAKPENPYLVKPDGYPDSAWAGTLKRRIEEGKITLDEARSVGYVG